MSQFIDHVFIEVTSGDGGNGMIAWRREKYEPMGGPAGGNGGRGGHIYFEATRDVNTLIDFRYKNKFEASNGERGRSKSQHGKNASDMTIRVPIGTLIRDVESGDVIADLVRDKQKVMVAEGGKGGLGNSMLASSTRRAPHFCEPGQRGIERKLELELKILADVGVVGLPNAGKSTLLSVVSAAKPKIADYPFSTLEPQLGVVRANSGNSFVVADIPGLVEGASEGIGLGHQFLRHIERTRLIIHLVDIASETVEQDIATIRNELDLYSEQLASLPRCLVLNKTDLILEEEADEIVERLYEKGIIKKTEAEVSEHDPLKGRHLRLISAGTRSNIDDLINIMDEALSILKANDSDEIVTYYDPKATERIDEGFVVSRKKNLFFVEGDRVERIVSVTNMREPESVNHMLGILRAMGVIDALIQEGAQPGAEVVIGVIEFTFGQEMS